MPDSFAPITITSLFAYEGPNIFAPQPGVLLRLRCAATPEAATSYPACLEETLKAGAQFIGMVLAYLDVSTTPVPATPAAPAALTISVTFTTPTPTFGTLLAAYAVEALRAHEDGDDEWDRDTPLFELQSRLHQQRPDIAALQLAADARARWLPTLTLPGGRIQIGYGSRGWQLDPAAQQSKSASPPPWERLGTIPIYAITGEAERAPMARQVSHHLGAAGHTLYLLEDADYDATLAALSNPATETLVVGLRTADILRRGLAFEQCTLAIVTDMKGACPPEALNEEEWARALGVPALLTSGPALLNTAFPALAALADVSPHEVLSLDSPGALAAALNQVAVRGDG